MIIFIIIKVGLIIIIFISFKTQTLARLIVFKVRGTTQGSRPLDCLKARGDKKAMLLSCLCDVRHNE